MNPNRDATILIVDDMPANLQMLRKMLEPHRYGISAAPSGEICLRIAQQTHPDLILLDVLMPEMDGFETCRRLQTDAATKDIPVIFITAKGETEDVVYGFEVGGVDYITKPFDERELFARVKTHLKITRLTHDLASNNAELTTANEQLRQEIARREQAEDARDKSDEQLEMLYQQEAFHWGIEGFIGGSQTIKQILDDVHKLQGVSSTGVLITGESGTGKELIARAIHFGGARKRGRFVPVNCSAIPHELAESTLFGHVKGAFTGADTGRRGCFELADSGTLFLDEIGDMPIDLQAKLLRVLEDGGFTPIGGDEEKHVDVRVLAATNTDIQTKLADGTFREDLYYRLARFTVQVPPLRERKADIPPLVAHFVEMFAAEMGIGRGLEGREGKKGRMEGTEGWKDDVVRLSPEALEALMNYDFPGNVRELKNIIEGALILSHGADIQPDHLRFIDATSPKAPPDSVSPPTTPTALSISPEQSMALIIEGALAQTEGDVAAAAHLLGLSADQVTAYTRANKPTVNLPQPTRTPTEEDHISAYIKQNGSITNSECQELLNADRHHAYYLLGKMQMAGLLIRSGTGRWAKYTLC